MEIHKEFSDNGVSMEIDGYLGDKEFHLKIITDYFKFNIYNIYSYKDDIIKFYNGEDTLITCASNEHYQRCYIFNYDDKIEINIDLFDTNCGNITLKSEKITEFKNLFKQIIQYGKDNNSI